MNKIYEANLLDKSMPIVTEEYAVVQLGTFSGTIYKFFYRSNGSIVPSDTGAQLIADRLK